MRTVLVTGANGQLGSRLMENPGQCDLRIVGFDRDELDITAPQSIAEALRVHRPDVVINAAAYTAVDRAEEEPELAHAINALGPRLLAEACAEHGIAPASWRWQRRRGAVGGWFGSLGCATPAARILCKPCCA